MTCGDREVRGRRLTPRDPGRRLGVALIQTHEVPNVRGSRHARDFSVGDEFSILVIKFLITACHLPHPFVQAPGDDDLIADCMMKYRTHHSMSRADAKLNSAMEIKRWCCHDGFPRVRHTPAGTGKNPDQGLHEDDQSKWNAIQKCREAEISPRSISQGAYKWGSR